MDQNLALHQAQMGILRLLGRLKNVEQVNELRQIISNYYTYALQICKIRGLYLTPIAYSPVSRRKAKTSECGKASKKEALLCACQMRSLKNIRKSLLVKQTLS